MKTSVVIAAYNRPAMLREAVASVLATENVEDHVADIIIVDDASTDKGVQEAMRDLAAASPRIVRTRTMDANGGQSRARNAGIEMATGDFILALDDDDLIAPTFIPAAAAAMARKPDAGIVYSNALLFGAREGMWEPPPPAMPDFLVRNVIPGCALFRKEDWHAREGYDESLRFWEDWDLWLRITAMGRAALRLNAPGFSWRRHPAGAERAGANATQADIAAAMARIVANNKDYYARVFPDHAPEDLPPLLLAKRAELEGRVPQKTH